MLDNSPTLTVRNLSKRYGRVYALDDVSADFRACEIHAVLGENGAGKSTLMGILGGFIVPDSGSVTMDQVSEFPLGKPFDLKRLGVRMVHQHFTLIPTYTVEENFALSNLDQLISAIDIDRLAQPFFDLATELNWNIPRKTKIADLPVGVVQRIEILKALGGADAKVLILDEPTAVLSPNEVDDLFRVLREVRQKGVAVILIAHKLAEILEIADRVTVLRKGHFIASAPIEDVNAAQLAQWMVGRVPPEVKKKPRQVGETLVSGSQTIVKSDHGVSAIDGIDFEIKSGEIVGFGGVDGNGQVELAEALAGVRRSEGLTQNATEIAYIPQDRQVDGLALGLSISDNLLIAGYKSKALKAGPFLSLGRIRRWVDDLITKYSIKVGSPSDLVMSLSGGNQQKVVVARSLDQNPDLVVAVNPTRGLDVGATQFVHNQLIVAAERGAAVALISTDLDELTSLGDRAGILSGGKLSEGISAEGFGGVA